MLSCVLVICESPNFDLEPKPKPEPSAALSFYLVVTCLDLNFSLVCFSCERNQDLSLKGSDHHRRRQLMQV